MSATTNSMSPTTLAAARADRWKALPFLAFMASSGLPLNYTLAPAHPMLVSDVAEMTYAAASSANSLSSLANLILLGTLYGMAGAMLLGRPHSVAAVLRRSWPLSALLLLLLASVLWTYQPDKVIMNFAHNIGVVLIALAAAMRYRHDPWLMPKQLGYVLGANLAVHIAAVLLLPAYAIDWQARWQGLTVHPNTLGALAFTAFWANASIVLCRERSDRYHLHLFGCALAVLAMAGADSVTSMMASGAALVLLPATARLSRSRLGRHLYISALALFSGGAMLFSLLSKTVDLGWLFDLLGRDAKLTGRAYVWEDAYTAIKLKPLLGWGFDDHAHLIASEGMPYSSYHNGVLDLAVNGGALAVVLLILLMLCWAFGFMKSARVAPTIAPFSAAFVISYIVHNVSEASYVSPRGQMWVLFLALLFLGACKRAAPETARAAPVRWLWPQTPLGATP
jgi:O-antigen ligase